MPSKRELRAQYEAFKTLWTDRQTSTLTSEILTALEEEFGPSSEDVPTTPLQHAVGWLSDPLEDDFGTFRYVEVEPLPEFRGERVCLCLECGQRMLWRPTDVNVQACSRRCANLVVRRDVREIRAVRELATKRKAQQQAEQAATYARERAQAAEARRRAQYAVLVPDHVKLLEIATSIQHQFALAHIYVTFVAPHCVANKWTVLQYASQHGHSRPLFVVLNGRGLGRAAWMYADSAEQAVRQVLGQEHAAAQQ